MEDMNKTEVIIAKKKFLVIDLTSTLKLDVKVYPGDPLPEVKEFSNIEKTGYAHNIYSLSDHVFRPHVDAPKHQNPENDSGTEIFNVKNAFNDACMMDLSVYGQEVKGIRYLVEIKKEHIDVDLLKGRKALIIRTGYDRWLEKNLVHDKIPYLTRGAADLIEESGIRVFGIDSLTIDPKGVQYAHKLFKDIMIIESMVHLYLIPENTRDNFLLQASPIRIKGATGGPLVAYAYIEL